MLEYHSEEWSYRTLPNKMYELVKNSGDMHKTGTGYFTDAESEMLTILEYLNHGVKTNITESMIEQIEKAINDSLNMTLEEASGYAYNNNEDDKGMSLSAFASNLVTIAKTDVCIIRYYDQDYTVQIQTPEGKKNIHYRSDIQECRDYAWTRGFRVKYSKSAADRDDILEIWI